MWKLIWKKLKILFSFFILLNLNHKLSCQDYIYIRLNNKGIIMTLNLEEYVAGVVYKEMGEKWPIEALKAQAVVSRTYAIWKKTNRKDFSFDLENSFYDQVFEKCKSDKIKLAVLETEGEILIKEDGEIAPVFFHCNSGGITTCPEDVWKGKTYNYYLPVEDPYSIDNTFYQWEKIIPKSYLSKVLGIQVKKINVLERDLSKRAKLLQIISENGKILTLTGNDFRMKVNQNTEIYFENPYIIPSTLFEIEESNDYFIFKGKGYGHGVGMSQFGAKKMAELGYTYREILKFYYPNFQIKSLYKRSKNNGN